MPLGATGGAWREGVVALKLGFHPLGCLEEAILFLGVLRVCTTHAIGEGARIIFLD
jgi:hypothetical protein